MANTLLLDWGVPGQNLYGIVRSKLTGFYWNGISMGPFTAGAYASYAVPLVEEGGSGASALYAFTVPAALPGVPPECSFDLCIRVQGAASPPSANDAPASNGEFSWDGTNLIDAGQVDRYTRALVAGKRTVSASQEVLSDLDGATVLATLPLSPAGGPFTVIGPKV